MNININLAEFGGVILALLSVGALLKHAFPNFPNRLIPLFTWVLGVVAYLAISKGWADAGQWIAAVVAAATATGAHSGVKNTMPEKGENIAPPLSLWLLVGVLSFGVGGCVTPNRLEVGGAYAGTAQLAAQPELFVLDASFDLAHAALDATFKHERANRTLLWQISPNIKRGLDKIRKEAGIVRGDYALARKIYEDNPTPAGLNELQTALNKLQVLNVAALNVVEKKGNQ